MAREVLKKLVITLLPPPAPITWAPNLLTPDQADWFRSYCAAVVKAGTSALATCITQQGQQELFSALRQEETKGLPGTHPIWYARSRNQLGTTGADLVMRSGLLIADRVVSVKAEAVGADSSPMDLHTRWLVLELLKFFPDLLAFLDPATASFSLPVPEVTS